MKKIRIQLITLTRGNEEYAKHNKAIANTGKTLLGVRMPDMRSIAKQYGKDADYQTILALFDEVNKDVYEEVCILGFVIQYSKKINDAERIELISKYLEYVDSWALVDSFITTNRKVSQEMLGFAYKCLNDEQEFVVRYGIIMMMAYCINDAEIDDVFMALREVRHEGYYVRMALAWFYATAAVKYYEKTLAELADNKMDLWIKRKSYTKMLESFRFTDEQKPDIRNIRKKLNR